MPTAFLGRIGELVEPYVRGSVIIRIIVFVNSAKNTNGQNLGAGKGQKAKG